MDADPDQLTRTVRTLSRGLEDGDREVGDLTRRAGSAGLLPVMTLTAMMLVSPLSGIPLFSSVCGLIISLTAIQLIFGRTHLWMPAFLAHRQIPQERGKSAFRRIRKAAAWMEARASPRLLWLTRQPAATVFTGLVAVLGLIIPFMEFVPMTSSLAGLTIALIGLGLMLRDGLLMLLALVPPVIAAILIWTVIAA